MFVQGSHGTIKINISLPIGSTENISILENALVSVKFKKKKETFTKDCIITDAINGEAMCYLDPLDLSLSGNYEYQVIIKYNSGKIVKSYVNSFYVQPSIEDKIEATIS